MPVVDVLALTPYFLELLAALVDGHLIVEVPESVLLPVGSGSWLRGGALVAVAHAALALQLLFGLGFLLLAFLLFLLLDECLDDAVDGFVARCLVHLGQQLERVLQLDGIGVGHQLVEYL